MEEKEILEIFNKAEGIITDTHVVFTSGKHGSVYVNKDAIYPHTFEIKKLCRELARRSMRFNPEVVAGPTIGGVILSQWTAYHLSELCKKEVPGVFAEEGEGKTRIFRRGYEKLIRKKRVLVVEDVLTTGGSVRRVVEAIRKAAGTPVGIAALVNRGGVKSENVGGVEIMALLNLKLETYPEESCPLCERGVPINVVVGKGKDFLTKKAH